jgi:Trk-type K+ transport system membrane component
MVPFQKAFPMVYVVIFLILAGNTSFVSLFYYLVYCPNAIYCIASIVSFSFILLQ